MSNPSGGYWPCIVDEAVIFIKDGRTKVNVKLTGKKISGPGSPEVLPGGWYEVYESLNKEMLSIALTAIATNNYMTVYMDSDSHIYSMSLINRQTHDW